LYDFDREVDRRNTNSIKWDKREEVFNTAEVIPLWVADADWPTAPEVIEALQQRVDHGVFGYTFAGEEYKEAVQEWYERRYGWRIRKDWIVFLNGVMPGMHLALRSLKKNSFKALIQPPVYFPFFKAVRKSGLRVVENPLQYKEDSGFILDLDDLSAKINNQSPDFLLFCSPHNPVGRVWEKKELLEVYKICRKNEIIIISDEIHGDFVFKKNFTPLASIIPEDQPEIITLNSPSKSFNIAGLQIAYAIIPEAGLRRSFKNSLTGIMPHPGPLALEALRAAYSKGEDWLEAQLKYLRGNIRAVREIIAEIPGVKAAEPEGTYLMWLDFSGTGLEEKEIEDKLYHRARAGLQPGRWFGTGGRKFYRLNLATSRKRLVKALKNIAENLGSGGFD